jgi:hypothetical protein
MESGEFFAEKNALTPTQKVKSGPCYRAMTNSAAVQGLQARNIFHPIIPIKLLQAHAGIEGIHRGPNAEESSTDSLPELAKRECSRQVLTVDLDSSQDVGFDIVLNHDFVFALSDLERERRVSDLLIHFKTVMSVTNPIPH